MEIDNIDNIGVNDNVEVQVPPLLEQPSDSHTTPITNMSTDGEQLRPNSEFMSTTIAKNKLQAKRGSVDIESLNKHLKKVGRSQGSDALATELLNEVKDTYSDVYNVEGARKAGVSDTDILNALGKDYKERKDKITKLDKLDKLEQMGIMTVTSNDRFNDLVIGLTQVGYGAKHLGETIAESLHNLVSEEDANYTEDTKKTLKALSKAVADKDFFSMNTLGQTLSSLLPYGAVGKIGLANTMAMEAVIGASMSGSDADATGVDMTVGGTVGAVLSGTLGGIGKYRDMFKTQATLDELSSSLNLTKTDINKITREYYSKVKPTKDKTVDTINAILTSNNTLIKDKTSVIIEDAISESHTPQKVLDTLIKQKDIVAASIRELPNLKLKKDITENDIHQVVGTLGGMKIKVQKEYKDFAEVIANKTTSIPNEASIKITKKDNEIIEKTDFINTLNVKLAEDVFPDKVTRNIATKSLRLERAKLAQLTAQKKKLVKEYSSSLKFTDMEVKELDVLIRDGGGTRISNILDKDNMTPKEALMAYTDINKIIRKTKDSSVLRKVHALKDILDDNLGKFLDVEERKYFKELNKRYASMSNVTDSKIMEAVDIVTNKNISHGSLVNMLDNLPNIVGELDSDWLPALKNVVGKDKYNNIERVLVSEVFNSNFIKFKGDKGIDAQANILRSLSSSDSTLAKNTVAILDNIKTIFKDNHKYNTIIKNSQELRASGNKDTMLQLNIFNQVFKSIKYFTPSGSRKRTLVNALTQPKEFKLLNDRLSSLTEGQKDGIIVGALDVIGKSLGGLTDGSRVIQADKASSRIINKEEN